MSLNRYNLQDLVLKQYQYKLRSYTDLFYGLVIAQVIALLLSFNGISNMNSSSTYWTFSVKLISTEIIIVFTMLWMFANAFHFTRKQYRDADFSFISNRLSSNLSSILQIFTLAVIASVTTTLLGVLLRVIAYFRIGAHNIPYETFVLPVSDLLLGVASLMVYLILVGSIGYFFGSLVQWNKVFVVVFPAFVIGLTFIEARVGGSDSLVFKLVKFYVLESSFLLFVIKAMATSAIMFAASIVLTNRLEVRK